MIYLSTGLGIGETILYGMSILCLALMHIFIVYGHIVIGKELIEYRCLDYKGWLLYAMIWGGSILLIGFWLMVFGI